MAVNGAAPFTVDLETQRISGPGGPDIVFRHRRRPTACACMEGLDDIGLDAQARRRDRRVGKARGSRAALAANGERQPWRDRTLVLRTRVTRTVLTEETA